jgi:hypothetical protein
MRTCSEGAPTAQTLILGVSGPGQDLDPFWTPNTHLHLDHTAFSEDGTRCTPDHAGLRTPEWVQYGTLLWVPTCLGRCLPLQEL